MEWEIGDERNAHANEEAQVRLSSQPHKPQHHRNARKSETTTPVDIELRLALKGPAELRQPGGVIPTVGVVFNARDDMQRESC